jgi:hypothetical protein
MERQERHEKQEGKERRERQAKETRVCLPCQCSPDKSVDHLRLARIHPPLLAPPLSVRSRTQEPPSTCLQ